MGYSFGYWWFKANVKAESSSNSKTESKTRYISSIMRIERYYASLMEEVSPINAAALELMNRQDYVGFFKACGPNYIRGIRRAQEVTAILEFKSNSQETASQYAYNVQVQSGWWNQRYSRGFDSSSKFNSISNSLKITILGYGLGLSEEGSESLIATSLAEYNEVMKFAYRSMVRSKNGVHIGQVYGIEVVPWVENVQFQVASGLQDEVIEIPLPRSLIPRAYRQSDPSDNDFVRTERDLFKCKSPEYLIDKYGYCCEPDALYNKAEEEYDADEPEARVCRPLRSLDKSMVKENMISNGEFVARLDRSLRFRTNQLNTLEKCISAARAIPERFDFHVLKDQDTVQYTNGTDAIEITPYELKLALDPFKDYRLVKHMAQELDEFMEMFYQPCLAALFGTNIGRGSDTEPSYFMAYPWYTHSECSKLSCFGNSMRWDRRSGEGGCIPSLISGSTAMSYDWNDSNCAKSIEKGDDSCKYDSEDLYNFHSDVVACWSETLPAGRIDYFMQQFCMPEITTKKISQEQEDKLKEQTTHFCEMNPNSNVPSVAPTTLPTLIPSQHPSDHPSTVPSLNPTALPSQHPSELPTLTPSSVPTSTPSQHPSDLPTLTPSDSPSSAFSAEPSEKISGIPTKAASDEPSNSNAPSDKKIESESPAN